MSINQVWFQKQIIVTRSLSKIIYYVYIYHNHLVAINFKNDIFQRNNTSIETYRVILILRGIYNKWWVTEDNKRRCK